MAPQRIVTAPTAKRDEIEALRDRLRAAESGPGGLTRPASDAGAVHHIDLRRKIRSMAGKVAAAEQT